MAANRTPKTGEHPSITPSQPPHPFPTHSPPPKKPKIPKNPSFILAAGAKGKRMALPNSRVMIHQPMGGAQGQAEDIKVEAAQIMKIRDNLVKTYSMMTGQTTEQVLLDLDRDNFMSAEDAKAYGLIDSVIELTS